MKFDTPEEIKGTHEAAMLQRLARAVIIQGIKDLVSRSSNHEARQARNSAKKFFRKENEDLEFWCLIGDLKQQTVIEQVEKIARSKNKLTFDEIGV